MITFAIAVVFGAGCFSAAYFAGDWGTVWSIVVGVLGFVSFQAATGFMLQKRLKRKMEAIQQVLLAGQNRLKNKTQLWRIRPPGSMNEAQRIIAQDTAVFVREALAKTEELHKFKLWVPMIERQIATAQVQLNWMVKDFKKVDALMPKVLLLDPSMAALKMARMYMLNADMKDIEKVYKKAVSKVRYNGNVLLAATWSWMQVQKGDADGAFKTLTAALKNSDDATLKRNHELLMNNRVAHFNNSGIGDPWYALYLEEPKVKGQRQHPVYR